MPFSKRTQKQVAERLKGNLDYYDKPHPWRTLRLTISALSLLLGIAAVPAYYYFRAPEFVMNPGPISRGHAQIANDCAACHPQTSLIRRDTHEAGNIVRTEYFVPIDQACAKCHAGYAFHQPNVAPDLTPARQYRRAERDQLLHLLPPRTCDLRQDAPHHGPALRRLPQPQRPDGGLVGNWPLAFEQSVSVREPQAS